MNAFMTVPGRRFLPLLAMGCILAGLPSSTRAGLLSSSLTERAALDLSNPSASGLTTRVVYESQGGNPPRMRGPKSSRSHALAALAFTMIIPAGTTPVIADAPAPPPPPPPPPPTSPPSSSPSTPSTPTPGGGQAAGTPEPGSLVLALTGSGAALLVWLRRRKLG